MNLIRILPLLLLLATVSHAERVKMPSPEEYLPENVSLGMTMEEALAASPVLKRMHEELGAIEFEEEMEMLVFPLESETPAWDHVGLLFHQGKFCAYEFSWIGGEETLPKMTEFALWWLSSHWAVITEFEAEGRLPDEDGAIVHAKCQLHKPKEGDNGLRAVVASGGRNLSVLFFDQDLVSMEKAVGIKAVNGGSE